MFIAGLRCFRGAAAYLSVSIALTTTADAQVATQIFGNEIYVSAVPGENSLMINGREALKDGQIYIWEIGLAGAVPYVLGTTGSGGTMCASVPFVVSFAGDVPSVDVSPLECSSLAHVVEDGQITFSNYGDATTPSRQWRWTPEDGFVEGVPQEVDTKSGWDAFRQRDIVAPSDLLQYSDLVEALHGITGEEFDSFKKYIYGPSDANYESNTFTGSNCIAHNCPYGGTLVVVDLTDRKMFAAYSAQGVTGIYPPASSWPTKYQEALEAWLAEW